MKHLFNPLKLGAITVPNRIFMAPLTRCRAGSAHQPNALMAEYYRQRASAGLIIAEATMVSPDSSTYIAEPGIYSAEQVTGWRIVTEAVHAEGGRIFLQIWHGGRTCHPLINGGQQPVAPSALAIQGPMAHTPEGKRPHVLPRALHDEELPNIVSSFRLAASKAMDAGFDGVEVHGANGYLLDEFLRDGSNQRHGPYGGSFKNRARLMLEVLAAVSEVCGSERVGLRLSPLNSFNDMIDSDPVGLCTWLAQRLNQCSLAYLHVMRGDFLGKQKAEVLAPIRERYCGNLVSNMGYTADEAELAIGTQLVDAVSFGAGFLANPDLPARMRVGAPWNHPIAARFYSPGPEGYIDYPSLSS